MITKTAQEVKFFNLLGFSSLVNVGKTNETAPDWTIQKVHFASWKLS